MVGAVGYNSMPVWQQLSYVRGVQTSDAAMPQSGAVPAVSVPRGDAYSRAQAPAELPYVPQGYSPEELATRTRTMFPDLGTPLSNALQGKLNGAEREKELENRPGIEVEEAKSPFEVMEDAKCETCEKRKYQDGSDDPGVSFKTAQHVDPDMAQSAVRGHEQEHVTRERAEAEREGRKVVSQTVTYHTGICPECGRFYIEGGTTHTVTAADNDKSEENTLIGGEEDDEGFDIA